MVKLDIDLQSDIRPITEFRSNSAELLKQVKESGRPLILTQRGRGTAVVLELGHYQALLERVQELQDIQAGLAALEAGDTVTLEDAEEQLLARFKS